MAWYATSSRILRIGKIDADEYMAYSSQPPNWNCQNERRRGLELNCSTLDILLARQIIRRTVPAHEMHGSSQTGSGWSIPAVTPSQRRLRLSRMRQSLRAYLGFLAMSLTVCLGHGIGQPISLEPPSGFSFTGYWQCCGQLPWQRAAAPLRLSRRSQCRRQMG